MRRGPVKVPYEHIDRRIDYLDDGSPDYAKAVRGGRNMLWVRNVISRIFRPYHFDSVADFRDNESRLVPRSTEVVFDCDLQVEGVEFNDMQFSLEVVDSGGDTARIIHPHGRNLSHELRLGDDPNDREYYLTPDTFNNPIQGALRGDILRVYGSKYAGEGSVNIAQGDEILVRNDALWKRTLEKRRLSAKIDDNGWLV